MRKILLASTAALALAGCQTVAQDRAATGAVLGGVTGAVIGGAATGRAGGALAGGVIGAAAGGMLGAATAPREPCYIRTASGRLRRVAC
jgi:osmotically inducible lipoprotein OsmB